MITVDFHGLDLEEAHRNLEKAIGDIRLTGKADQLELITGRGMIHEQTKSILEAHEISYRIPFNNPGCIMAEVD